MGPAEVSVMLNGQPWLPSVGIHFKSADALLSPVLLSNFRRRSMSFSFLPRWKFTDSCGRPQVSGALHVGCTHDSHTPRAATTRRAFFKTGVAVVSAGG